MISEIDLKASSFAGIGKSTPLAGGMIGAKIVQIIEQIEVKMIDISKENLKVANP